MILLLLATLAQAADVFEFCTVKKQKWSERYQEFETKSVRTYYSYNTIQFIVYDNSFENNRDIHPIIKTIKKQGKTCWVEHENSELCYDKYRGEILWEKNLRSGETWREVMGICRINGE